jgi:S-DNA-T family DNA segregation ATPase FtsK/SpoIIIE
MAAARKPPARRKSTSRPARRPARRARRRPAWRAGLPVLEQHHLDLLGLASVCLGVFLAFPLYLDWEGGRAGEAIVRGARWLVGEVAYASPVGFVAAGAAMVLRPVLPAVRPLRTAAACLVAGTTLAYAAGTLGLGPAGRHDIPWRPGLFRDRGGILGDALHQGTSTLFGPAGAHIAAVFLLLAGVMLLTGATVAGVVRATSTHVAETTRALRPARPARRPAPAPVRPPEPDHGEPVGVAEERAE